MITALGLFAVLGFGLGYAAPGAYSWLALILPIGFFLLTWLMRGFEGRLIVVLVISLAVTGAAILLGKALDARQSAGSQSA